MDKQPVPLTPHTSPTQCPFFITVQHCAYGYINSHYALLSRQCMQAGPLVLHCADLAAVGARETTDWMRHGSHSCCPFTTTPPKKAQCPLSIAPEIYPTISHCTPLNVIAAAWSTHDQRPLQSAPRTTQEKKEATPVFESHLHTPSSAILLTSFPRLLSN